MRVHRLALSVLAATGLLASAAGAAGPPLPSTESGRTGVIAPGGTERFLALPAGSKTNILVHGAGGRTLRSGVVSGGWSVPAVTMDGATTGLSADGGTLLLARVPGGYPPKVTRLAVVDARSLTLRRKIVLHGFFTVDAISPDGRWAYLVHYPTADVLQYRVRALELATGRFAAADVVDPRNPHEKMGGLPMTRAIGSGGRWVYTLYGGGRETFIHALDTVGRTAACIDLPMLERSEDLSRVRLTVAPGGGSVEVSDGKEVVASVEARTFAVREVKAVATATPTATAAPARARAVAPATVGGDGGFPSGWVLAGLAAAGLLLLTGARARRRAASAGPEVTDIVVRD